jgi:hypothetical protein
MQWYSATGFVSTPALEPHNSPPTAQQRCLRFRSPRRGRKLALLPPRHSRPTAQLSVVAGEGEARPIRGGCRLSLQLPLAFHTLGRRGLDSHHWSTSVKRRKEPPTHTESQEHPGKGRHTANQQAPVLHRWAHSPFCHDENWIRRAYTSDRSLDQGNDETGAPVNA